MSFDVKDRKDKRRIFMSDRDLEESARCGACKILPICGGWGEFDDSRWCSKECGFCRAICCGSPRASEAIKQIGGLGIMNVKWKPFETELPPVVPQLNAKSFGVEHPAYGLSAKKIYYPDSGGWSKEKDLKARFGIPKTSKLVLSFSMKDLILDSWSRNLEETCDKIAEYEFDYACAMNFSMYYNYPPLDRLINMRRRFYTMELLQDRGVKVIPGIGWVRPIDLRRQAEWCRANRPSVVSVNFTTNRQNASRKDWKVEVDSLLKFREMCGYHVNFMLTGASGPKRLKSMVEAIDGLRFYDAKVYRYAEFHRCIWSTKEWDYTKSVRDHFFDNLEYLSWLYESTEEEKQDRIKEVNYGR